MYIHTVSSDGKTVTTKKELHHHDRYILAVLMRGGSWLCGLLCAGLFTAVSLGGLGVAENMGLIVAALGLGCMAIRLWGARPAKDTSTTTQLQPAPKPVQQQVKQAPQQQPQQQSPKQGGQPQPAQNNGQNQQPRPKCQDCGQNKKWEGAPCRNPHCSSNRAVEQAY